MSNLLAVGLMAAIGVGLLAWYYANWVGGRANAREAAQSSAQEKAEGEINLRPLGRVDPPSMLQGLLGEAPEEPPPEDTPDAWLAPAQEAAYAPYTPAAAAPVKTPEDLRQERLLAGRAFASSSVGSGGIAELAIPEGEEAAPSGDLTSMLRPSVTPAVQAQVLPTRRLLLPKGAFLDCTLETALDSTLPGMTTCILATDTFSADGRVVLLERGTKLVGETRGQVRQGAARVFVLWTEARTPGGVVVPLASPGTDELGRSGLPGQVNGHFFERFGAAILVSVIDGVIQTAIASQRQEGSTVVVDPSGTRDIMTEVLRSTVNIPPTVVKPQGDRIQVLVARDLDFRSVYELKPVSR
ncbi:MAG: type IV secretion system protein VirB10 [Gammaproteobacteria bacterium]|nr:MAG: type IV secretion system protein VirB10 [Gammaproteobacteria bacterium]